MTVHHEHSHNFPPSDISKITDGMLDAASHNTADFDELYAQLRAEHSALLNWLFADAALHEASLAERKAHIKGALALYALLLAESESRELAQLLEPAPPTQQEL